MKTNNLLYVVFCKEICETFYPILDPVTYSINAHSDHIGGPTGKKKHLGVVFSFFNFFLIILIILYMSTVLISFP